VPTLTDSLFFLEYFWFLSFIWSGRILEVRGEAMIDLNEFLNKLGLKAKDRVTGMEGVITSIAFDLYGCVHGLLRPPVDDKGAMVEGMWLDMARLEIKGKKPVMDLPTFFFELPKTEPTGPEDKPVL
jgi:hypothetical protein